MVGGAGDAVVGVVQVVVVDRQTVEQPDPAQAVVVVLLADQDVVTVTPAGRRARGCSRRRGCRGTPQRLGRVETVVRPAA